MNSLPIPLIYFCAEMMAPSYSILSIVYYNTITLPLILLYLEIAKFNIPFFFKKYKIAILN